MWCQTLRTGKKTCSRFCRRWLFYLAAIGLLSCATSAAMADDGAKEQPCTVALTAGVGSLGSIRMDPKSSAAGSAIRFDAGAGFSFGADLDITFYRNLSIGVSIEDNLLPVNAPSYEMQDFLVTSLMLKAKIGKSLEPFMLRPGIGIGYAQYGEIRPWQRIRLSMLRLAMEIVVRPVVMEVSLAQQLGGGSYDFDVSSDNLFMFRGGVIF